MTSLNPPSGEGPNALHDEGAAVGEIEEQKAQENLGLLLNQGILFDSTTGEWVDLAKVPEAEKAVVSLPRVSDEKRQYPPDIMIFVSFPGGRLLVCSCDIKSGSVGNAWQITRGRIFKAFANKGFWTNIAGQPNILGSAKIVANFARRAGDFLEKFKEEPSQNALDEAKTNLAVGTGFFLTPTYKREGATRGNFAQSLDESKGKTRLVITGAVGETDPEGNTWLLIGRDEATRAEPDKTVLRVIRIWGQKYTVERVGPPAQDQTSQLRDEQGETVLTFPTSEENEQLYNFIIQQRELSN
jgi:hypothetical protein